MCWSLYLLSFPNAYSGVWKRSLTKGVCRIWENEIWSWEIIIHHGKMFPTVRKRMNIPTLRHNGGGRRPPPSMLGPHRVLKWIQRIQRKRNISGRTDPGFPTPGAKMTVVYTNSLKIHKIYKHKLREIINKITYTKNAYNKINTMAHLTEIK